MVKFIDLAVTISFSLIYVQGVPKVTRLLSKLEIWTLKNTIIKISSFLALEIGLPVFINLLLHFDVDLDKQY